jgi:hypothetical protein
MECTVPCGLKSARSASSVICQRESKVTQAGHNIFMRVTDIRRQIPYDKATGLVLRFVQPSHGPYFDTFESMPVKSDSSVFRLLSVGEYGVSDSNFIRDGVGDTLRTVVFTKLLPEHFVCDV